MTDHPTRADLDAALIAAHDAYQPTRADLEAALDAAHATYRAAKDARTAANAARINAAALLDATNRIGAHPAAREAAAHEHQAAIYRADAAEHAARAARAAVNAAATDLDAADARDRIPA